MKVLVTGGAGFIGANLCHELVARRNHEVVVLDDLSTGRLSNLDGIDVDVRVATVLDTDALRAACRGVDSIVHLAAVPSVPRSLAEPRRSHEINATGTLQILEAARATGAHVVVASSSSVYGRNPALPKSEDQACMPASPYAASKLAAESYALAYQSCFGLECVVFRFFNVFGPLQPPGHAYAAVIPRFIWAALRREPLVVHGDGEQSRDFTFIDSVVDVLAESVQRRPTIDHPVNLAFGTRTTLNELVGLLSTVLGGQLAVTYGPPRPGDVRHSQASDATLRQLFPAVNPVPLDTGLLRTVEWTQTLLGAENHAENWLGAPA
jgi:UDP-glucose 4-epimerase